MGQGDCGHLLVNPMMEEGRIEMYTLYTFAKDWEVFQEHPGRNFGGELGITVSNFGPILGMNQVFTGFSILVFR